MSRRSGIGFSLLEVLAVVLLTSIVIGAALNHYVNLSRASQRAMLHTRDVRRAAALLDRITRDFESVTLVKKQPEEDPLNHPWVFVAESVYSDTGADHIKFMKRGRRPIGDSAHESDLQVVAYSLSRQDDESFQLWRWTSSRLPEGLDRDIPDEDDGAVLVADDLASFGLTFVDTAGGLSSSWDSSQVEDAASLPLGVNVEVAFADAQGVPRSYRRRLLLLVRPFDLEELFDPRSEINGSGTLGGEEDEANDELTQTDSCLESNPCSQMLACDAIRCEAKMGRFGYSTDQTLKRALEGRHTVCQFIFYTQESMLWLIDNPACRRS